MKQLLLAVVPVLWAAGVLAQQMPAMPGMNMPGASQTSGKTNPKAFKAKPKGQAGDKTDKSGASTQPASPQVGKDMSGMKSMRMPSGSGSSAMPGMKMPLGGSAKQMPTIPESPPPPPPRDHAADRYYDPAAMEAARVELRDDHGGGIYSKVMANIAEFQSGGRYRWDGQAWIGGDINRLVLKSEGSGTRRDGPEEAELQALYSRAVGVYTDFQAGVRYDFKPTPSRTYATVGVQTIFPYWFSFEGALFLSSKGELLARLEGTYDLMLTRRLVLQPRVELNFAAQNSPDINVGSGLSDAELGLRLRYEIRREFAPYIGVSYNQKVGRTAYFAHSEGKDPGAVKFVTGIRAWF
ncbi:MAG: copper resistance protein B [Nitrospiraceae bacterium]|nr:copper resistance protein B [Nitrospiraceae bacterium]MBX9845907.1 copper resistance protein B [Xanthobacteraceae bacterium]